jgi:O-antigen/teichoic acid export membrane protein
MVKKINRLWYSLKDNLLLGSSNISASLINGVFWFYIALVAEKSDYGNVSYLISFAFVGSTFAKLGLTRILVIYEAKKEEIVGTIFFLGMVSSTITAIIVYFLTQNIETSILVIGLVIYNLELAQLNSKKKYGEYSKNTILRRVLTVILAVIFYHIFGINGIVLGFALATFPAFRHLYINLKNGSINFKILNHKIGFILNNFVSTLSINLFWWGDKILIGSYFGFVTLGEYQLASQYLILLNAIPNSLFVFLLPQESEGKKNFKIKLYAILFSVLIVILSYFLIPLAIPAFLPDYENIIIPIQVMIFGLIPITISILYESKLLGHENSKIILISTTLQIAIFYLLIIILGKEFSIFGIAIAFLSATIVRMTTNVILSFLFIKN